ncbi:putative nucleotidyltransferase substrate binding domain-containing protein [Gynuella sunshinyii]|uniref:Putative signal-transduction protein containing cAMP-binding and CBS domain n=1 Tax=Gynuella sunshinyii YC6258 TaxID=1445510 RepID=A0A0C5VVN2_9GAMM|nr:putative nucleotidyltransferase substrate binding domain-containing protein [Gynuella sunshinyii]AJQ97363.1 putative signal-transduction protein containing cAMP-binding and CBS domain [Gynuella sunshinyii YC6258]
MSATIEITEVISFLQKTPPFQFLDGNALKRIASGLEVQYIKVEQSTAIQTPESRPVLHIIRRGAFEIRSQEGLLVDRLADGECFGISSILENNPEGFTVIALEDSLVYRLDRKTFQTIADDYPSFLSYFTSTRANRLRKLFASQTHPTITPAIHLSSSVDSLMSSGLIATDLNSSVQAVAKKMTAARVSSILVLENEKMIGILTDRDLRSRVLANALPADTPVGDIMTHEPVYLAQHASIMEALLLMSERDIHHLPIISNDAKPVGMITSTDLLRNQQLSPLLLASEISRQTNVPALINTCKRLPALINNLVVTNISPVDIGRVVATISDNLIQQLIKLAMVQYGQAPMDFNFLVFGSLARREQSLGSDQDNALMLESEPNEQEVHYFNRLARFVSDGLHHCGFPYCPGNIMATNPTWMMSRQQWQRQFNYWIEKSTPKALLNASIFFDIRSSYGPEEPARQLVAETLEHCKKNSIFLATLTKNALRSRPPLGFFRNLVLESTGEHKNELDLKHNGIALINDLARIYGLAAGETSTSTIERLQNLSDKKIMSQENIHNLQDAWMFLSELRLQTQHESWQRHGKTSAYLDPTHLSQLERRHLKATFKAIANAQDMAKIRFANGLPS